MFSLVNDMELLLVIAFFVFLPQYAMLIAHTTGHTTLKSFFHFINLRHLFFLLLGQRDRVY